MILSPGVAQLVSVSPQAPRLCQSSRRHVRDTWGEDDGKPSDGSAARILKEGWTGESQVNPGPTPPTLTVLRDSCSPSSLRTLPGKSLLPAARARTTLQVVIQSLPEREGWG